MIKNIIILLVILAGLVFYIKHDKTTLEGFSNSNCYNILIKKNNQLYLYNQRKAHIPGVNPIKFNNLEEYIEFTEWQRTKGIRCPILYYRQSFDAQNNSKFDYITNPLQSNTTLSDTGSAKPSVEYSKLIDANRSSTSKFNKYTLSWI